MLALHSASVRAIGDDRVPIGHHICFCHDRQGLQVGLGERLGLDAVKPARVPGRFQFGKSQRLAQRALPLGPDLIGRPGEAR